MNSTTHKIVGISTIASMVAIEGSWYAEIFSVPVYTPLLFVTAYTGSILADADMESTEMGRKLPWVSKFTTHRGLTHTPVINAVFLIACILLMNIGFDWYIIAINSLLMGLFISYATHIFIDTFNYKGCPIFWPIYRKNIYIFRVSTANKRATKFKDKKNNWQEPAFSAVWVIAIIIHTVLVIGGYTL